MTTTANRLNDLTIESTETALDAANLVQRQNATLAQSWLTTLEANQQSGRELVRKSIKQTQEAQNLWLQHVQETFRATTDSVARAAGSQLREMSEHLDSARGQTKNGTKKPETAAK
jgi:hypothetical protein